MLLVSPLAEQANIGSVARDYAFAELGAEGQRETTIQSAESTLDSTAGAAENTRVQSLTSAIHDAEIADAQAYADMLMSIADDLASFDETQASNLQTQLATLATNDNTPWANQASARATAEYNFIVASDTADHTRLSSETTAQVTFTTSEADAWQTLTNAETLADVNLINDQDSARSTYLTSEYGNEQTGANLGLQPVNLSQSFDPNAPVLSAYSTSTTVNTATVVSTAKPSEQTDPPAVTLPIGIEDTQSPEAAPVLNSQVFDSSSTNAETDSSYLTGEVMPEGGDRFGNHNTTDTTPINVEDEATNPKTDGYDPNPALTEPNAPKADDFSADVTLADGSDALVASILRRIRFVRNSLNLTNSQIANEQWVLNGKLWQYDFAQNAIPKFQYSLEQLREEQKQAFQEKRISDGLAIGTKIRQYENALGTYQSWVNPRGGLVSQINRIQSRIDELNLERQSLQTQLNAMTGRPQPGVVTDQEHASSGFAQASWFERLKTADEKGGWLEGAATQYGMMAGMFVAEEVVTGYLLGAAGKVGAKIIKPVAKGTIQVMKVGGGKSLQFIIKSGKEITKWSIKETDDVLKLLRKEAKGSKKAAEVLRRLENAPKLTPDYSRGTEC